MSERGRRIPLANDGIELSCLDDCNGACCRAGTSIWLPENERFRNLLNMRLRMVVAPRDEPYLAAPISDQETPTYIPAGFGFYEFQADCGHLTSDARCAVYETGQPTACGNLQAGSIPCLVIRAKAGFTDEMPPEIARVVLDSL